MKMNWIPIKFREPTEEEKELGLTDLIYDCEMPDDGQEVLVTYHGRVYTETISMDIDYDSGYNLYYTENGLNLKDCTAWAPMLEPYKTESEEKND